MKKRFCLFVVILSIMAIIAGCGDKPNIESTEDATGGGDEYSYYIDEVYAEQIGRYYTALFEKWEIDNYFVNEMSLLPYFYYEGDPLENVGFGFVDLDNDNSLELVIGAILNAELDPTVFEIWTLVDGKPVMLAQGGSDNRYYLQYSKEDQMWYVANAATNNAANWATYYFKLKEGNFEVIQGILFDAFADEENPWFKTHDMDWDTSNDEPIDEETANTIQDFNWKLYTALDYFPYTSVHSGENLPQKTPEEEINERVAELSQRFGLDICIPKESELEYTHYDAYALTDLTLVRSALDILEENLALYPEGFLRQLCYGPIETVRIELVGGLAVKDGVDIDPGSVGGFAQNNGNYYLVVFNGNFIDSTTIFHEISHLIDVRLDWDSFYREDALYSEKDWLSLQPEGFAYAMSYTEIPEELLDFMESSYFINWYAMTFPTEDRATLMEAAMNNDSGFFELGSGRREKLQYYADCIRDGFDTTGWPETTLWEQVLK